MDTKKLFTNREYVMIFICFVIMWGNYNIFAVILSPLLSSILNPSEIAVCGISAVMAGLIGSVLFGMAVDKTQNYKLIMRLLCIVCAVIYTMSVYLITLANFWVVLIVSTLIGLSSIPILAVAYPFAILVTKPIIPASSNGYMITISLLYCFPLSLLLSKLCEKGQVPVLIFYSATQIVGAICSLMLRRGHPGDVFEVEKSAEFSDDDKSSNKDEKEDSQ